MTANTINVSDANAPDVRNVAVVLAAHGSTRRPDANAIIESQAERMRQNGPFANVSTAFLIGNNTPFDVTDIGNAETVVIVPFMMSDGFLAEELSSRIKDVIDAAPQHRSVYISEPVGTHDGIAAIVRHGAFKALNRAGLEPHLSTLVVVAHGSSGRGESKICAMAQAERLRADADFAHVSLAMLEEAPFLDDVLGGLSGSAVVSGLFAAPGGHAIDDINTAVSKAGAGNPDIINAGPVGIDPRMADIATMRALGALTA